VSNPLHLPFSYNSIYFFYPFFPPLQHPLCSAFSLSLCSQISSFTSPSKEEISRATVSDRLLLASLYLLLAHSLELLPLNDYAPGNRQ
jgi:hypothetical protein